MKYHHNKINNTCNHNIMNYHHNVMKYHHNISHHNFMKYHHNIKAGYKRQISMLVRFIAFQWIRASKKVVHEQRRDRIRVAAKFYYKSKTNNKSCQIMWSLNTSICIRNILVGCVIFSLPYMYITRYLHRDYSLHEYL